MLHVFHLDPTKLRVFALMDNTEAKRLATDQREALGLRWTHVANVARESVDEAFELTNHIDHDWTTNAEVQVVGTSHLRSTSVGDIVVRSGRAWLCASFGWADLGSADFLF